SSRERLYQNHDRGEKETDVWSSIDGPRRNLQWPVGIGFADQRMKQTPLSCKWTSLGSFNGPTAGIRKWRWRKGSGRGRYDNRKSERKRRVLGEISLLPGTRTIALCSIVRLVRLSIYRHATQKGDRGI